MNIKIPELLKVPSFNGSTRLISIEGVDGVGKTSVCQMLDTCSEFNLQAIPEEFNEFNLKKRMIIDASWMASAFFFLSGVMETKREIETNHLNTVVIMDRSFWSTLAVNWVKEYSRVVEIIKLYKQVASFLPIPNQIIVLLAEYEECRRRIDSKLGRGKELDQITKDEYKKEVEFYYWLSCELESVKIINTSKLNLDEVTREIKETINHNFLNI